MTGLESVLTLHLILPSQRCTVEIGLSHAEVSRRKAALELAFQFGFTEPFEGQRTDLWRIADDATRTSELSETLNRI